MSSNDFPPIITYLGTQVGKQSELDIVIPKTSKLYYTFTNEDDVYRAKPGQTENPITSWMKYEDIEPHIISIEKNETSIKVKLNIENLQYQTIRVAEDYNPKNLFVFDYDVGHGYVVKIKISNYSRNEDESELFKESGYLYRKYIDGLKATGYKSAFSFSHTKFRSEQNIALISTLVRSCDYTLNLDIYDRDVYRNYDDIDRKLNEKNIESKFQILNTILK